MLTFAYVDVSAGTHDRKTKEKEEKTIFAKDSNHKHGNRARAYVMLTLPYVDVSTPELTSGLRLLTST